MSIKAHHFAVHPYARTSLSKWFSAESIFIVFLKSNRNGVFLIKKFKKKILVRARCVDT